MMKQNQIIHQAIEREISLGKFLLSRYAEKIKGLEKKYKVKTAIFILQFAKGAMGDEQDFFEWLALYNGKKRWEEKLSALAAA